MNTKNWKYGVMAAIAAAGLSFTGCRDTARGVESDANRAGAATEDAAKRGAQGAENGARDVGNAADRETTETKDEMRGTGGAGEAADDGPDIGNRKGVINDGEGPLERGADGKIGDRPGVINDGEGPLEKDEQPKQQ
jgi:predicted small secreted protein